MGPITSYGRLHGALAQMDRVLHLQCRCQGFEPLMLHNSIYNKLKFMILSSILFTVMVGVFISYVLFIWTKYGIQKSISESYYVLPKKENFLFILFCWLFAFPAMLLGDSYLMLFAGGGIVFVGASAAMHTFPTRMAHLIGAIGGMILACLAMIFQYHMWYMVAGIAGLIPVAYLLDKKHLFWWIEVMIFTAISTVIGISLL